ncbi:MAG: right-handed parallel beta-helix repeat-containing protein [Clostridia bacterium]|nr:right-handed parallel beta-helix repeat-containing protein [Clostridia bacterium]
MKNFLCVVFSALLLLTMLSFGVVVASEQDMVIVNVKDFGAKGDGKTNDYAAMMSAFDYAITHYASKSIPVTVYFPEGEYGLLRGGMYVKMPYGSGNLTVKGAGADKSTIVYLNEWDNGGSWVALRLQLEQDPSSVEDYLHDIVIEDLGVYDTDPVSHAWHPDKGDPGKEETHGFNIQHCVRATIRNCKVDSVGDEAIDMSHCIDSEMVDNLVINSPGAGSAGGGISVGDGSNNVLIARNTSLGSIGASNKVNWAIAVEALEEHIEDVIIEDNVIQGIHGYGLNIGAPAGTIANVLVQNNIITDCSYGSIRLMGSGQTTNVQMLNNTMTGGNYGVYLEGSNKDQTLIENCVIENTTNCGIKIDSPSSDDTAIRHSIIRSSQYRAIYNAGSNTKVDHMLIDGVGLSGGVDYAILQYIPSGATTSCSEVSNTVILNCQSKRCTYGVQRVVNTLIEQVETSGYVSIAKADLIKNCKVNRIIQAKKGSTIDGLVLYTEANLGTHAITLSGLTDCTVTNCAFVMLNNSSRNAVFETNSADANTITNNVSVGGKGIKVIGANTVSTGNVTGTYGTTDIFRYRVVDGKVTITEWLDKSCTDVMIPAVVEDYPVVAIEPWAFMMCDDLTTITIPDSITAIGANAFYMCDALTNVNYFGSKADWNAVAIGENNDALLNAVWCSPAALYSETVRHSVMDTDHGNGLAFRFELQATGIKVVGGNRVSLTNATVNYFGAAVKLVGLGAVVTNDASVGVDGLTLDVVNGQTVLDVPTVYLQDVTADSCAFATRIINIPDTALNRKLYVRPYYIVEVDGEQSVIYGDTDSASCIEYM